MEARRLIEGSTFTPETLEVLYRAFDQAWLEVSEHYAGHRDLAEDARTRLAHAVLLVGCEDSNDPGRVKNDALQMMALAYQARRPRGLNCLDVNARRASFFALRRYAKFPVGDNGQLLIRSHAIIESGARGRSRLPLSQNVPTDAHPQIPVRQRPHGLCRSTPH
jgi:hypothetical protein